MAAITKTQLQKMAADSAAAITRAKSQVKTVKAQAEKATMTIVQSMEIGVTSFGFGVLNGRYDGAEVAGMPADLGAAILCHTIGLVVDDQAAEHLHNIGDGALASFATVQGIGVGKKWQDDAQRAALAPVNPPATK